MRISCYGRVFHSESTRRLEEALCFRSLVRRHQGGLGGTSWCYLSANFCDVDLRAGFHVGVLFVICFACVSVGACAFLKRFFCSVCVFSM